MEGILRLRRKLPRRFLRSVISRQAGAKADFPWNTASASTSTPVMVFGSSTGVGKTIISAGLCRAALFDEIHGASRKVCYIKPVQTGELDEYFIRFYTNPEGTNEIFTRTLYHWLPAMSPHLAATKTQDSGGPGPVNDTELVKHLLREMNAFWNAHQPSRVSSRPTLHPFMVVETAGGVLSPGPSKTLQADLYRPLRLPIILVGDAKLGGITTTLTALESLRLRGYTVHAIAMIEQPGADKFGNNLDMVQLHLEQTLSGLSGDSKKNPAWSLAIQPKVFSMTALPREQLLHSWFKENDAEFTRLFSHVEQSVKQEQHWLIDMHEKGSDVVWWPFTQHAMVDSHGATFIESAHGDRFRCLELGAAQHRSRAMLAAVDNTSTSLASNVALAGVPEAPKLDNFTALIDARAPCPPRVDLFDASASWWTQSVGHGNKDMALAIAEAAGRFGHVMFPNNLHPPAVQLSRYMLGERGPGFGWASRVFFSDDGSTAMEIALKMALRLNQKRAERKQAACGVAAKNVVVLVQQHCYHGDTLGTMDASGPSIFNEGQHPWYHSRAVSLPLPLLAFRKGIFGVDASAIPDAAVNVAAQQPLSANPSMGAMSPLTMGSAVDVESRMDSALGVAYRNFIDTFLRNLEAREDVFPGALILEPLLLGAGGFLFVDPLYQKILVQECKARGIPVVFDEVAVGMWRLGPVGSKDILNETPDIACYGKMLTGGYLPMALTLASNETYEAFLGPSRSHALLHGHSYTANPLGCAAALEAIRLLERSPAFDVQKGTVAPSFSEEDVRAASLLPGVLHAMGMGSVLAVTLSPKNNVAQITRAISPNEEQSVATSTLPNTKNRNSEPSPSPSLSAGNTSSSAYESSCRAAASVVSLMRRDGLYARPLGNVVYVMATPLTPEADRRRLTRVLRRALTKAFYMGDPQSTSDEIPADTPSAQGTVV